MINFTNRTTYYISPVPTDMRKGYEGLASVWCGPIYFIQRITAK